jgi:hypothetical protein
VFIPVSTKMKVAPPLMFTPAALMREALPRWSDFERHKHLGKSRVIRDTRPLIFEELDGSRLIAKGLPRPAAENRVGES